LQGLLMPDPKPIPGFIARDVLRVSHENAWVVRRALDAMLIGRETTDTLLPQLKMPVLLEWGGADRIAPVSEGEAMHRLVKQSELDVAPGCGHLAPGECAGTMGPEVVGFLKAVNSGQ
jgi:pimeloyl-ACP methyl ester carboxylesterase